MLATLWLALPGCKPAPDRLTLLNASFDPTRELFDQINPLFVDDWARTHGGERPTVLQSHGGSGKQARAVLDGLPADVVTLALSYDIDQLHAKGGLVAKDWATRLPHHGVPFHSTIVFLVRRGNPKGIHDWADLVRDGVSVITPNPKTGGGARWNYLAAWGAAELAQPDNPHAGREMVTALYRRVPVLDSGARGSTTTFAKRGIGDVLITWECEAWLAERAFPGEFETVVPKRSIRAEPPVAWVDAVVQRKGTAALAQAYLEFLYTPAIQTLAAENHYRPSDPAVADTYRARFAEVELFTIDDRFGGCGTAQRAHRADGGLFDQVYDPAATGSS
ncbi:MAG: sulfate ABC transporter substrate-binding protein, partial [Gemmataceae bacterium]|nr:sulfate ABC transporter substrate-binding protein [Gemmataceae bacterium]